ncbi:MAG: T9SS type A sorting domain-containing protein, partial [Parafilimonas sp.]
SGISWSIQPNPATENTIFVFNNNLSSAQIILNDAAGKVVYQKNLAAINAGYQLSIPLNNMAKGVYFIKIISDSGTQTQKLVVEK